MSRRSVVNASQETRIIDCKFEFDDFNETFEFELIDIDWQLEPSEITFHLDLQKELTIGLILNGFWDEQDEFHIAGIKINLEKNFENPLSVFLTSTLWTLIGLTSKLRIVLPQAGLNLNTSLNFSINETSRFLQERQLAHRLLVISSAAGVSLPFPKRSITGEEVETIAFCFHAIKERTFQWFAIPTLIPWIADEESLSWLPATDEPTSMTFQPEFTKKYIFGVEIPLGFITANIDKAIIENYDEAKKLLSRLDGSTVNIKLVSLTGTTEIILLKGIKLPENPFSEKLQALMNLDPVFDDRILERFFSIASSTVEGLTKEQIDVLLEESDLEIE